MVDTPTPRIPGRTLPAVRAAVPRVPAGAPGLGLRRAREGAARLGWRRGLIGAAALIVLAVAAVQGYQRLRPAPKAVPALQTVAAAKRSIVETVALPGTAATGRQAKLSFSASGAGVSVSGTVKSVSVKTGDLVKQGQEIARLDTTSLDFAVQSARSALTVAQLKQQQLLDGALPADLASAEQAVITAATAVLTAQNNLTTAQTALDAIQRQSNLAAQLGGTQQAVDRMNAQAASAQRDVDAAIARTVSAGADSFTVRSLESAIADLVAAVRTRCAAVGARDRCAALAESSGGDLTALVAAIDAQTSGGSDPGAPLAAFTDASGRAGGALRAPVTRLVQATAALPGLSAQVNTLAFTQSGSAGSPTAEALANAIRSRDAAAQALEAAKTGYSAAVSRRTQVFGGPLPVEVLLQQQSVAQAALSLEKAMNEQRGAILFAPFDGAIGTITMNVGELSGSGSIILIDPNAMQLVAASQEADIAKIRVGQPAGLSFDAYSGVTLPGVVTSVAPDATVAQGVASYAVVIGVAQQPAAVPAGAATAPQRGQGQNSAPGGGQGAGPRAGGQGGAAQGGPQGASAQGGAGRAEAQPAAASVVLRPGMTGTGNVEIQRHDDVLAVPSRAVKRQGRTSVVTVLVDGKQEVRTVTTGASDSSYVQITSGLNEGALVVIPSATTSTTTSTAAPLPGGGGGFGGPGGGLPPVLIPR